MSIPFSIGAVTRALARHVQFCNPHQEEDVALRYSRQVICLALGMTPLQWACNLDDPIPDTPEIRARLQHILQDPQAGLKPPARLAGYGLFYGRRFGLSPETLDPRWETEGLVDCVVEWMTHQNTPRSGSIHTSPGPLKILDLGTGSGCILITLISEYGHAVGTGVDLSRCALQMAAHNARLHQVQDRCFWLQGSWMTPVVPLENAVGMSPQTPHAPFDILVSNPPYIASHTVLDPEVTLWDPPLALYAGDDGLEAYRTILDAVQQHPACMRAGGLVALEIGHDQGESVAALCHRSGLMNICIHKDAHSLPRFVTARTAPS